jgi:hypothetical protein
MSTDALSRLLSGKSAQRLAGQTAAGAAIALLAAALSWFSAHYGSVEGMAAITAVAGALWLATTERTALALALFMIYIGAVDGYLKLATGSPLVTIVRDVLLYALVVGLLVRAQLEHRRLPLPPLTVWVIGFVVIVLSQVCNPHGGTILHSLAGVRQHLEFVPLFFLTFAFVRTKRALTVFVVLLLLVSAANGVVSLVQFRLTPQELAGWGPGYAERVQADSGRFSGAERTFVDASGTERVRPFGLGSEAGGGGIIGAFALAGVIALASLFSRLRYLLFAAAMAIGAVSAVVTSQGRGVLVCSFVVVLAYGLLTATSRGRAASLLGLAAAGLVSTLVVLAIVNNAGSSAFRYQGLTTSRIVETTSEARGDNVGDIVRAIERYPLGAGLATAGPASGSAGGTALTGTVDAESEFSFMAYETGVAGMLLILGLTTVIFGIGLLRSRHEPDREVRVLLAAIVAPVAGMLVLYYPSALTATTPTGPYLWAVAGIVSYWLVVRPRERTTHRRHLDLIRVA